jgi:hypothetical protein
MKKLLYISSFLLIMIGVIIFKLPLFAQEGMPVKFDTVYLYAYYSLCEENCPQTTPPWNPLWYYYKIEQNEGTEENAIVCSGPEANYFSPFYLNIHYLIYPQPGFINNFTDPGGDFEEFLGGVFPITFERPTLNFYDTFDSKEPRPRWTVPDSLLYGDGLGVPLQNMNQRDPVEGDLVLYSRIFPFPPPWEEYTTNPMYSAPPFLSLWEEIEDANADKAVVIDGYMGVTLKAKEMFGKTKDVKLPRLNYHYEECDPGCKELAAYAKTHGARGVMPNPLNPEDNVSYQIDSEAINICSRGYPGGPTGIALPPDTVVNPQGGVGMAEDFKVKQEDSNFINEYLQDNINNFSNLNSYKGTFDKNNEINRTKSSLQVYPPLGPYPDYVEVYRDGTGFHDAVATVNLSWVLSSTTLLQQIEDRLAPIIEECAYGDNCTISGVVGGVEGGGLSIPTNLSELLSLPLDIIAIYLRFILPEEEVYNFLKNAKLTFEYVRLDYSRTPYSDSRCPVGFNVYSIPRNGVLMGPTDIFELIEWQNGIIPSGRTTIDERNADFLVLGIGEWDVDKQQIVSVAQRFENLHNMECEYTVAPTYYIGGSFGTDKYEGDPFTVVIKLYN